MVYNLLKISSVVFFIVTFFPFLSESNCFKKLSGRTVDLRKYILHRPLVLANTHARWPEGPTRARICQGAKINISCFLYEERLPFAEGQAHLNPLYQPKGCGVGLPCNDMTLERQSPLFR